MKNVRRGRDEDTIVWHFRSLIHHMTEEDPMLRSAIMDGSGNVIGYIERQQYELIEYNGG